MLMAIYKNLLAATLLVIFSSSICVAQVISLDPANKYPHQGQITAVDKTQRLLTIEKSIFEGNKARTTLKVEKNIYKIVVGAKLRNMPRSQQYSGVKNLKAGMLVSFKLKKGTEKKKIPSITELWVEAQ